jgi:hypothetical protein
MSDPRLDGRSRHSSKADRLRVVFYLNHHDLAQALGVA